MFTCIYFRRYVYSNLGHKAENGSYNFITSDLIIKRRITFIDLFKPFLMRKYEVIADHPEIRL